MIAPEIEKKKDLLEWKTPFTWIWLLHVAFFRKIRDDKIIIFK